MEPLIGSYGVIVNSIENQISRHSLHSLHANAFGKGMKLFLPTCRAKQFGSFVKSSPFLMFANKSNQALFFAEKSVQFVTFYLDMRWAPSSKPLPIVLRDAILSFTHFGLQNESFNSSIILSSDSQIFNQMIFFILSPFLIFFFFFEKKNGF